MSAFKRASLIAAIFTVALVVGCSSLQAVPVSPSTVESGGSGGGGGGGNGY